MNCSAFLAKNSEGDVNFARNLDCKCGIGMVTNIEERKGKHSLSITNMSNLDWEDNTYDNLEQNSEQTLAAPFSPSDGANEHGLAVAILTNTEAIYPSTKEITIFDLVLPRVILDQAKNVQEAIQIAGRYNLFSIVQPLQFMVADREGNSAVIELFKY